MNKSSIATNGRKDKNRFHFSKIGWWYGVGLLCRMFQITDKLDGKQQVLILFAVINK